jgi:hypothetical protein
MTTKKEKTCQEVELIRVCNLILNVLILTLGDVKSGFPLGGDWGKGWFRIENDLSFIV